MLGRSKRRCGPSPLVITALAALAALASCTDKSDADYRADVTASMYDSIAKDLDSMIVAGLHLQASAPNRAWSATKDADAINDMQEAWKNMRRSWEHVEGAIAALFPDVDDIIDGRYEAMLGATGDSNLFDATGVIGMHGIERILYATGIKPEVIAFESELDGYEPAAYPATDDEAISFKTVLVQRLIKDASDLRKRWQPVAVDIGTAYQGLVGLMNEQKEKVNLAATGEEESRYANITMFDLRSNLDGTQKAYNLFREWIHSKAAGPNSDSTMRDKFIALEAVYKQTNDDAIPAAPLDWQPEQPTDANLATPFGMLWKNVHESVDPKRGGSVVYEMNRIGGLLGLPPFVEE
jgi:iron uptake system component EfeO